MDNSGYITEAGLTEVFHREGRMMTPELIHEIVEQADLEKKGKISFEYPAYLNSQNVMTTQPTTGD